MRIKGPTSGPSSVGPTDSAAPIADLSETSDVRAAEATSPAVRSASLDNIVAHIAGQLRAGAISTEQAVSFLIDDTVDRHFPSDRERSKLAAELRDLLVKFADSDPHLVSKIRRLTGSK